MGKTYYSKSLCATIGVCIILLIAGCKKENNSPNTPNTPAGNLPGAPTPPTNSSPYFLTASLSGEAVSAAGTAIFFNDTTITTSNEGCEGHEGEHAGSNGDPDDQSSTKATGGKWTTITTTGTTTTTAVVEMKKLAVRVYVAPKIENHFNMVAPGAYSFASSTVSGAYVAILDSKGVVWTTNGDQTGSVFQIISRGDSTGTSTTFAGSFTAKMYNSKGAVKQVTNGTFSALAGL